MSVTPPNQVCVNSEHQLRGKSNELKIALGRERNHFFTFPDVLLVQIRATTGEKWLRMQLTTGVRQMTVLEGSNHPHLYQSVAFGVESIVEDTESLTKKKVATALESEQSGFDS